VRACFEALGQLEGARETVLTSDFPVMLWNGPDDPSHNPMKVLRDRQSLPYLSTAGDRLGMVFRHGAEGAKGIRNNFPEGT